MEAVAQMDGHFLFAVSVPDRRLNSPIVLQPLTDTGVIGA